MRLSKFQVVAVTLACLLMSASAQAQFGKLKTFAKDKLGMQAKENKAAASATGQNKVPAAGGAKTTFAPGGKKSLDVSREDGPTSEARVDANPGQASPQVKADAGIKSRSKFLMSTPGNSMPSKATTPAKSSQPSKSSPPHK